MQLGEVSGVGDEEWVAGLLKTSADEIIGFKLGLSVATQHASIAWPTFDRRPLRGPDAQLYGLRGL
jgi:hypothetical protein